jgi:hypothetical protein
VRFSLFVMSPGWMVLTYVPGTMPVTQTLI